MVKRSRVLDEHLSEAEIPYEETRLARKAPRARRRLLGILAVGALALAIEAVARDALWGVLSLALVGTAVGLWRERLGGLVATGLAALFSALVGVGVLGVLRPTGSDFFAALVAFVLGAAALPDVVTLIRDAELQHAYGRWAKRG